MVLCCFTRSDKNSNIDCSIYNYEDYNEDYNEDYKESCNKENIEDKNNDKDNKINLDINNNYFSNLEKNINDIDNNINNIDNSILMKYKLNLNEYYIENLEKQIFMIENGYWVKNSKPWNGYFSIKNKKFPKYILKKYNEPPNFIDTYRILYIDYNKVKGFDGPILKKNKNPEYNIIFQIKNTTKNIRYTYIFPNKKIDKLIN